MATTMDAIELSKENVQPLRRGRNPDALNTALGVVPGASVGDAAGKPGVDAAAAALAEQKRCVSIPAWRCAGTPWRGLRPAVALCCRCHHHADTRPSARVIGPHPPTRIHRRPPGNGPKSSNATPALTRRLCTGTGTCYVHVRVCAGDVGWLWACVRIPASRRDDDWVLVWRVSSERPSASASVRFRGTHPTSHPTCVEAPSCPWSSQETTGLWTLLPHTPTAAQHVSPNVPSVWSASPPASSSRILLRSAGCG